MDIPIDFIKKYDKPGPRYTSYPPATFFNNNYKNSNYKESLIRSNNDSPKSISIYIHIPFCPQRCHFCGCNTVIGKSKSFIERYIDALLIEIKTVSDLLDKNRLVTQIHWGGGTPNSISYKYIEQIMNDLKDKFNLSENCEIAIECSPAYLSFKDIDKLSDFGFNRISLGVQDFREDVLEIINRKPPKNDLKETIEYCRKKGFKGINIDLIYGLPGQTVDSFVDSVKKAIDLNPDRLVTFSYAHVPWVKEYQKVLEKAGLPKPEEKIKMLINSLDLLTKNGYIAIGMDHFAKPDDEISIALKNKKLHRNFQGYCTKETTGQVYGFGATAISQLWEAYSQNDKNIDTYVDKIEKEGLAVERGYSLSKDEQIRRVVINEIMCNNYIDFSEVSSEFELSETEIKKVVDYKIEKLEPFRKDGLIDIQENKISVNQKGNLVVRNIAMAFDPILETRKMQYSKTV